MTQRLSGPRLFPLPAIVPQCPPKSRSRRLWQRFRSTAAVTELANTTIKALNTLSVSFSSLFVSQANMPSYSGSTPVLSSQQRLQAHIFSCASRFLSRQPASAGLCDSDLPLSHSIDSSRDHLFGYIMPTQDRVPLVAARVSLPSDPGSAALLDVLPPDLAEMYAEPSARVLKDPSGLATATSPRGAFVTSHAEYVSLIRRMMHHDMIDFCTEPKAVNGVFGIDKDDHSIRLIIDARPANKLFVESPDVQLPGPDLLAELQAPADQDLFVAKLDIDNFYHRLLLPEWMRPYFALPAVSAQEVGLHSRFGMNTLIFPCCRTLPMGWSHAVFVAQSAHEHLLKSVSGFSPEDRITPTTDRKTDRMRHAVYVDDLAMVGRDEREMRIRQDTYISFFASKGLVAKPSKIIRPSADGVSCLGLLLHGKDLTFGLSRDKLLQLCKETQRLLDASTCTGRYMSRLVGKWVWPVLVCRPALSVFSAVYRFIQAAGRRPFNIWNSVKRELQVMMGLVPLLFASLSAEWLPSVVATDASSSGGGVVYSTAESVDSILHLNAQCLEEPKRNPKLRECLAQRQWKTAVATPWRKPEHINLLELRAVELAIKRLLSSPASVNRRVLLLCDSQVVVGALSKGRSSSHLLLRRLRGIAALLASAVGWLSSVACAVDTL